MKYPFELCIKSMLGFCDQVVAVDAGSTDGTIETLEKLHKEDPRFEFYVEPVDFSHPRWAIHQDGYLKGKARAHCTGDFCWQMDTDEIVAEYDFGRIHQLCDNMNETKLIMLPMIEFWGSLDMIRGDFFSWKPRFSVNEPGIGHGIPNEFKCIDSKGHEYPKPYDSDSCNYIYTETQESVPIVIPSFRKNADISNMSDTEFERYFFEALDRFPHVFHISWLDLPRKIKHYQVHWGKFHASMYNEPLEDTAENNRMFDKPWGEVSDADIKERAHQLKTLGPRFFSQGKKFDPAERGLMFRFNRPLPSGLKEWVVDNMPDVETESSATFLSENKKVSCIIPLFDAPDLDALISDLSEQTYKNIEVLITACSEEQNAQDYVDRLKEKYNSLDISLLRTKDRDPGSLLNHGIRYAGGTFLLPLLKGVRLKSQYLERAVNALSSSQSNIYFSAIELPDGRAELIDYNAYFIRYMNTLPVCAVLKKSLWETAHGYSPAISQGCEWNFWISCSQHMQISLEQTPMVICETGINRESNNEYLPLFKMANSELYPVEEVLEAHQEFSSIPGISGEEVLSKADIHRDDWLLQFMSGLIHENSNQQAAMESYSSSIYLSNQMQWQPIYRLGIIVSKMGKSREAQELFHHVRTIRPDMASIVNRYFQSQP